MTAFRAFLRHQRGASAAEFTLVLPLLLLLLFATIDFGRYGWELAQAEKATQTGARWAVATNMVASGLNSYSYAVNGGLPQGSVVNSTQFPGVTCQSSGGAVSCTCSAGGSCPFPLTADSAAFTSLVTRMAQIYPEIEAQNVVVTYAWSGLGFAGDPNGPDVAPLTTVSLRNLQFAPFTSFAFNGTVNMPELAYTLPMEDGSGTSSN
jgi:Flp pilus assembly protein TadG